MKYKSKLDEIMDRKGISDKELAEFSGLHKFTIKKLREGTVDKPKYRTLRKIAAVLEVKANEL